MKAINERVRISECCRSYVFDETNICTKCNKHTEVLVSCKCNKGKTKITDTNLNNSNCRKCGGTGYTKENPKGYYNQ